MRLVRRVVEAVVACVGAERARLREPDHRSVSVAAAGVSGIVLAGWGNGLVLLARAAGPDRREIVTIAGQAVAVVLVTILLAGFGRFSPAELGWKPARLRGRAGTVLAVVTGIVVLAVLAAAVRRNHCEADGGTAVNVVRLLTATAVGEEVLFRGALFAVWSRTTATDRDLVVANCSLFALWHVAGAFEDGAFHPLSVVGPGVGGLLFLWGRCRFSWVVAAAALHATTLPLWVLETCG